MNEISNNATSETIKDLNNLRNTLNNSLKQVNNFDVDTSVSSSINASDLLYGTKVIITTLNQKGTIIGKVKNNKVLVQVGNNKLNIDISNLELDYSKSENKKYQTLLLLLT